MQTRKEIDRRDIKLAIDMLADIDDPATEHILGVLEDCGNEIAKLRAENEHLREDAARLILLGEYKSEQTGVVWFDKNPHAFKVGTTFYAKLKGGE